jgi:hypothetical protein
MRRYTLRSVTQTYILTHTFPHSSSSFSLPPSLLLVPPLPPASPRFPPLPPPRSTFLQIALNQDLANLAKAHAHAFYVAWDAQEERQAAAIRGGLGKGETFWDQYVCLDAFHSFIHSLFNHPLFNTCIIAVPI